MEDDCDRGDARDEIRGAWKVFSVTSIGVVLTGLNTSMLDIALPTIARDLGATPFQASWILLSYVLVTTLLILSFGRLADLVGRRVVYIAGTAAFAATSLGCGLAQSATLLICFRVLQAVGAAAIITNTTVLLTDALPARMLGVGLGYNVAMWSSAQVTGPLVAGLLVDSFGWRSVFLAGVPLAVVGTAWAARTLPRGTPSHRSEKFDYVGAVLSFAALGGIVFALSRVGTHGWSDRGVVAAALGGLVGAVCFVYVQNRARYPLLDLTVVRHRARALGYTTHFLMGIVRTGTILAVSIYLQAAWDYTPSQAGVHVFALAAGMMPAAPLAGRLAARWSSGVISAAGCVIASAGVFVVAVAGSWAHSGGALVVGLLLVGVGSGAFTTPNTSAIMGSVPADRRGAANGVRSTLFNSAIAIGTATSLSVLSGGLPLQQQKAVFAGTVQQLAPGYVDELADGYRTVLISLAVMAIASAAASLVRATTKRGGAPA